MTKEILERWNPYGADPPTHDQALKDFHRIICEDPAICQNTDHHNGFFMIDRAHRKELNDLASAIRLHKIAGWIFRHRRSLLAVVGVVVLILLGAWLVGCRDNDRPVSRFWRVECDGQWRGVFDLTTSEFKHVEGMMGPARFPVAEQGSGDCTIVIGDSCKDGITLTLEPDEIRGHSDHNDKGVTVCTPGRP